MRAQSADITEKTIRQLRAAKDSCPVTVHQRLENALKLIEQQAAEIERLKELSKSK